MSKKRYATGTKVPASQTVSQIENLIKSFGVDVEKDFSQVKQGGQYQCYWSIDGITFTAQVDTRDATTEAEVRRLWRVLWLYIKSQLVFVEEGWLDSKLALAPFLMLPDGSMGKERLTAQIAQGIEHVSMPQLSAGASK